MTRATFVEKAPNAACRCVARREAREEKRDRSGIEQMGEARASSVQHRALTALYKSKFVTANRLMNRWFVSRGRMNLDEHPSRIQLIAVQRKCGNRMQPSGASASNHLSISF
jgi:hypothetical protein